MTHAHTLTRHRDIQAWVAQRRGLPALVSMFAVRSSWTRALPLNCGVSVDLISAASMLSPASTQMVTRSRMSGRGWKI